MGMSVSAENLSEQWSPDVPGRNPGMGNRHLCDHSRRVVEGCVYYVGAWLERR